MKKIVIIITIILIISIVILILINKNKISNIDNQEYLTEIIYDSSGDMNGSVYNVSLNIKDQVLTVKEKDYYDQPFTIKEYSVSKEDIDFIKRDISNNKYPEWEKYKMDESLFAYDAASKDIKFEYDKNELELYTINLNLKITFEQRKKLNNFIKFFLSLAKEDKFIKEYVVEE